MEPFLSSVPPCLGTAEHAKTAVRGNSASVAWLPGAMAGAGGKQVFRRGRDNHRRSCHLHQNEVAEAWGEDFDKVVARFSSAHPLPEQTPSRWVGFCTCRHARVRRGFYVLLHMRPITPDAGARWNPQHDTAKLPESSSSLRSGELYRRLSPVLLSLCPSNQRVFRSWAVLMSVARYFTRCLAYFFSICTQELLVLSSVFGASTLSKYARGLASDGSVRTCCARHLSISTPAVFRLPISIRAMTASPIKKNQSSLLRDAKLEAIYCMLPPSRHHRSLATRKSVITTNTDPERSREVGGGCMNMLKAGAGVVLIRI